MIFSRVSIEFGSSHPPSSTLKLLINDEVGDVDLQKLSDEEINRLGYFRLADASPCPGVFSSTVRHLSSMVEPMILTVRFRLRRWLSGKLKMVHLYRTPHPQFG